jgi:CrcB protein
VTALFVALGGAFGTWLRYAVNVLCAARSGAAFPYATLTVNLVGSFALALLSQLLGARTVAGVPLALVLGTGVLGGFTTYSSFNLETLRMLQAGEAARAAWYAGLTFVGCLGVGAVGWYIGVRFTR